MGKKGGILLILPIFVVMIIFLAACTQQSQQSQPKKPYVSSGCEGVECSTNSFCVRGECICKAGSVECNGICLGEGQCCTDADCDEGLACEGNECIDKCERTECNKGMVCDTKTGDCICGLDSKFCAEQGSCILKENCCSNRDCTFDEVCLKSRTVAELCIELAGSRTCKVASDGVLSFFIDGISYKFNMTAIDDNAVTFLFQGGNVSHLVQENQGTFLDENDTLKISVADIRTTGGRCEEDMRKRSIY